MNIHVEKTPPAFTPVTVTLVLHSQQELDALGCLFDCGITYSTLNEHGLDTLNLWELLQKAGADLRRTNALAETLYRHAVQRFGIRGN